MNFQRIAFVASLCAASACAPVPDFAPADINFSEVKFTSSDQAYDAFFGAAYAVGIADSLVGDCPLFGFDAPEETSVQKALEVELESYFGANPEELPAFLMRLTGDPNVTTIAQLEDDEDVRLSEEVVTDMLDRIRAYYLQRGRAEFASQEDFSCYAANLEKQSGSLIGRFLFRKN